MNPIAVDQQPPSRTAEALCDYLLSNLAIVDLEIYRKRMPVLFPQWDKDGAAALSLELYGIVSRLAKNVLNLCLAKADIGLIDDRRFFVAGVVCFCPNVMKMGVSTKSGLRDCMNVFIDRLR